MPEEVKVTLKRSLIGVQKKQKATVRALGLRKINSSRVFKDGPALRGQIRKVRHLILVETGPSKVEAGPSTKTKSSKKEDA